MKRKISIAWMVLLVLVFVGTATAQTTPMMDSLQNRCIKGFEFALQIGVPSPMFFEADFGMMTRGHLNLGLGGSIANIQAEPMFGGYAKIGIFTFNIIEGKMLAGIECPSYYGEIEFKCPIALYMIR